MQKYFANSNRSGTTFTFVYFNGQSLFNEQVFMKDFEIRIKFSAFLIQVHFSGILKEYNRDGHKLKWFLLWAIILMSSSICIPSSPKNPDRTLKKCKISCEFF